MVRGSGGIWSDALQHAYLGAISIHGRTWNLQDLWTTEVIQSSIPVLQMNKLRPGPPREEESWTLNPGSLLLPLYLSILCLSDQCGELEMASPSHSEMLALMLPEAEGLTQGHPEKKGAHCVPDTRHLGETLAATMYTQDTASLGIISREKALRVMVEQPCCWSLISCDWRFLTPSGLFLVKFLQCIAISFCSSLQVRKLRQIA